jgi:protein-L-isoaspartate(D-aspartate) O-methyltransferase
MAWSCSGRTNKELIENLFKNGLIKSPVVKAAMEKVSLPFSHP